MNLPNFRDPFWGKMVTRGSWVAQGHGCSPAISLVDHVEVLQSGSDVMGAHARGSADGLDADVPLVVVVEIF